MTARLLAVNVAWSMFNQLLSRGSMMLAAIFLARYFDTYQFASYSYFQLTIFTLATYAALGLGPAASRFFAEYVHESSRDQSSISLLWGGSVLLAIIAACVVLLLPHRLIDAGLELPRWLLAAGVFIMALQAVPAGAALGLEEFKRSAIVGIGSAFVMFGGIAVALIHGNIRIAMMALLLAMMMQVIGVTYLVISRVGLGSLIIRGPVNWEQVWKVLSVSLPLAGNGIVVASGTWLLGRIILGGSGHEHAFALYSIGMQWFALAMFLPGNMGSVFLARMVRHAVTNTDGRAFVRKAIAAALATSFVIAAVGALASPLILGMYGAKYQVSPWMIAAYMAAAVVTAPVTTLGNALLAHGGQWFRFGLAVAWCGVLTTAGFYWRDVVGYGGAMAVALAYSGFCVAMYAVAKRMRLV